MVLGRLGHQARPRSLREVTRAALAPALAVAVYRLSRRSLDPQGGQR